MISKSLVLENICSYLFFSKPTKAQAQIYSVLGKHNRKEKERIRRRVEKMKVKRKEISITLKC